MNNLTSHDELRSVYRPPNAVPLEKVIHTLDEHCVDFLAKSPFMVLSTANADGTVDGSPKGGEPGFVSAIDDLRIAWADLSGNNRLDSFENIVTNPAVALLFMIPGLDETLRINGTAELSTDPELCESLAVGGRPAKVAVVVTIAEAYVHCNKAFRRSSLWDSDSWISEDAIPDGATMFKAHAAEGLKDMSASDINAALEKDAKATMWAPGGDS